MTTTTQTCGTVNGGSTWTPSDSASLVLALNSSGGGFADGSCSLDSSTLSCINFDFSSIPVGASIGTISATVSAKGSSTSVDMDSFSFTLDGSTIFGANSPQTMTTSYTDYTISEMTGFSFSDIVGNTNFGVLIGGTNNGYDTKHLYIDSLSVTVTYFVIEEAVTFGGLISKSKIFDSPILATENFFKC